MIFALAAPVNSLADESGAASQNPLGASNSAKSGDPATTQPKDDVASLIKKLGDDLFAVREAAANQLAKNGIAARPQLMMALSSSDAEVRFRARHILAVVVEADFQKRLAAFSADIDGKQNLSMPAWTAFKRVAGGDPAARDVFVEMQQSESTLLEAYEEGPKAAAEMLRMRAASEPTVNVGRGRTVVQPTVSNLGSILTWLLVVSDPDVPLSDDITAYAIQLPRKKIIQEAALNSSHDTNPQREVCRKVLGRWMQRNDLASPLMMQNLIYAAEFNLKEGVTPAAAVLKMQQSPANFKSMALLIIQRFGTKEHLPLAQALLEDHQLCFDGVGNNQPTQVQLRDVALVTTIVLSEQDPTKFGFDHFVPLGHSLPNLNTIAFASDTDRQAAFQKWQEWQAGQRQAMGEKPASKSGSEKTE
jgi:hypothetical protein